ncbi:MAG: TIGR02678 family protein [Eubacterium sp.]|nr:TIGR02678 family protein [Eubacterium sp.]
MNEVRTLIEQFWICKDNDKETYYKVKRDIPNFQRFVRAQLGWKLIHTENLLKLEKRPAHAEPFMGIQEFSDIRDYCILCVVLMYLEDKEEQEQFLLSELIDYVETQLKSYMQIDWTSFTQRKSLVRVLLYMEKLQMLRVYEGSSEAFGIEAGQEVLYENTGYSKYFATSFPTDISGYESWKDFEQSDFEELQEQRGSARINRVYRQLVVCPSFYWENSDDGDAYYLKNQRQWVGKYLEENVGGMLEIYKNSAFLMLEESDYYGVVHPRDAQLPEVVLLICAGICQQIDEGKLDKQENECIVLPREAFTELVMDCRNQWERAWSKEYREMDNHKMLENVTEYMRNWMMLREEGEQVILLPAVGRLAGMYPDDFQGGGKQ